ncbi:hypothetical protein MYCO108962_23855 [Mycobacterium colombiense]
MVAGLLQSQAGGQRTVGVADRGEIGGAAVVGGLYPVVEAGQVVGTGAGDVVVADTPAAGQRLAEVVEAGHLRRVVADPGDRRDGVVLVAGSQAQLPQRFASEPGRLVRHAADGTVHRGVEAGHRDRHVGGRVGVADGDRRAGLPARFGVQQHEFSIRAHPDGLVDGLEVGQVFGPVAGGIVLALPRLVGQAIVEDRSRLVGRRNVLALRPIRMRCLECVGLGGGGLGAAQLGGEGEPVVMIAVHRGHPVVVADVRIVLVLRIFLLRRERAPHLRELPGVIGQRGQRRQRPLRVPDGRGVVAVAVQGSEGALQRVRVAVARRLQLPQRGFGVADGIALTPGDERFERIDVGRREVLVAFHVDGFADQIVELLQLGLQRGDLCGSGLLRLSQRRGDVFQVRPDLGQLQCLRPKRFRHPLHLVGVVDRMAAVPMVPRGFEAGAGLLEGVVGLGRASPRPQKRPGQIGDLQRAAGLQALVDRPRVATGCGDQRRDAEVAELHGTVSRSVALQPPRA